MSSPSFVQEGDDFFEKWILQMNKSSQDNKWLAEFFKAAVEMSGWIAAPIIAALYLGQWLDEKNNSGSLYFLSLTGIAFVFSCIGLGLVGKKYLARVENNNLSDKKEENKINGDKSRDNS